MKYLAISIMLLNINCDINTSEISFYVPTYSPKEIAEKMCKILHMEGNETLKTSIEDLFTEKNPSPTQLVRRENIIKKLSESEE